MSRLRGRPIVGLVVLLTVVAVACGNSSTASPTFDPTAISGPESSSRGESGVTPTPASQGDLAPAIATLAGPERTVIRREDATPTRVQDAVRVMRSMVNQSGATNFGVVTAAGLNGEFGLVPVLIEMAARTFDPGIAMRIADSLESLTGERVGGDFVLVAPWYKWLAKQPEFTELPGFDEWKGQLYGRVDPGFRDFFYEGVPARIPLWTIQWGGVAKDGIPPLENPSVIPATSAEFMLPDEPVFGVLVNGEARAYPHRIMGWHELANDELGGRQITVVF